MSLLHCWANLCFAVCFSALAFPAAVSADAIDIDCGQVVSNYHVGATWTVYVPTNFDCYFGCVPGAYWGMTNTNGPYGEVPAPVNGLRKINFASTVSGGRALSADVQGPFTSTPKAFNVSRDYTFYLYNSSSQQIDSQTITFNIHGSVIDGDPPNPSYTLGPTASAVFSLTGGGVSVGKSRVPVSGAGSAAPVVPSDTVNVITNVPAWAYDDSGRPYSPDVPNYTVGSNSGSFGSGTQWHSFSVDHGAGGVPSFVSSAFPGAVSFTSGSTTFVVGAFGQSFTGGGGTVNFGPDGSAQVSAWGSGFANQLDLTFPAGFKPGKVNLATTSAAPPTDVSGVDPCFSAALTDLGLNGQTPPPGGGSSGTPSGTPADSKQAGAQTPGGGTGTQLSGPAAGGVPSKAGGTTSTAVGGVGGNPVGGSSTTTGPGSGGSGGGVDGGSYGYSTPGPLPEDGQDVKDAGELAKKHVENVNAVQAAAGGLSTWAQLSPTTFGQAGTWSIPLSLGSQTYDLTIPTEHASLVRAILLLVVQALFICAGIKLILSL